MKLDDYKSGKGEAAWNDILRGFDSFLGVTPIKANAHGNTLTIVFPDSVATATPIELANKIVAGAGR